MKRIKEFIQNNALISSALLTILFSLAVLCLFNYNFVYDSNDDYLISMLFSYGDSVILFIGYYLSNIINALQSLFPEINCFVIFQLVSVFASLLIMSYVFIKKYQFYGLLISALIQGFYICRTIVIIQWTHTATIICVAGSLLAFYATCMEVRKGFRLIQIIGSFFLFFISSQIRFRAFEVCMCFFAIACICIIIKRVCTEKNGTHFTSIFSAFRKYFLMILVFVLSVVIGLGTNITSNLLKETNNHYNQFVEYNHARALVQDYNTCYYSGNEDFFNSIGIYSQEDLDILTRYFIDDEFYTVEKLNLISDYSQEHGKGPENIFFLYFKAAERKITNLFGNEVAFYAIVAIAVMLFLTICYFIFKIREKIKVLFPFALFIIWCFSFWIIRDTMCLAYDYLLFPFFLLVLISVVVGNRYQVLYSYLFSIVVLLFRIYISFDRISFRVVFTFSAPAFLLLLFVFDVQNIRKKAKTWNHTRKGFLYGIVASASAFLVFLSQSEAFNDIVEINKYGERPKNEELVDYINSNKELSFLYDYRLYPLLDSGSSNPLLCPNPPSNTVFYGDWQIASDAFGKVKAKNGISTIFEDMINCNSIRLLLDEHKSNYNIIFNEYFKNHYVNQGKHAELILEESFDGVSIYSVER